ncbi:MAG: hypothetical protein IJY16_08230 [Clostridia bacterium]|nr:hypothetical protein [Clostridia bacterium]
MKKLLQDLWYGNLAPIETLGQTPEYREKLRQLSEADARLRAALNEEQTTLLENLKDCEGAFHLVMEELVFQKGFCLASRLLLEALWDA